MYIFQKKLHLKHIIHKKIKINWLHTRRKAFWVAISVEVLPNIVVKPNISNSGDWNAMKIAMASSSH